MEPEDYSEQEHTEFPTKQKTSPTPKKKNTENNCKRFSDEQVKSLESMFSQKSKLEPRKKIELAKDLGLHPRQVSIWFQNKRARWKSKQIEQQYRVLKDNFDALNQQFESLKKENESLLEQIHTLRNLSENSHGRQSSSKDSPENGEYRESENRNKISKLKENDDNWTLCSDEDEARIDKYLKQNHEKEEIQFLSLSEHGSSSLASPDQQWCNLPSGGFLDESCSPSSWWNL